MMILEIDPTLRKVKLIQREELRQKKKQQKFVFAKIKKAYTSGMALLRSGQAKELEKIHLKWERDEQDLTDRLIDQVK